METSNISKPQLKKQTKSKQPRDKRLDLVLKSTFARKINSRDQELFDDFIPFGLTFLSNQIRQPQCLALFPEDMHSTLSYPGLQITVKSQQQAIIWQRRLELIKQSQATNFQLKIQGQQDFTCFLFNYLEPIGFPDLKVLNLYSCKIQNIQVLAHFNAPNLKTLNLIYNQIYTFKSFQRSIFQLKNLYLISTSEKESRYKSHYYYGLNRGMMLRNRESRSAFLENYSRWNFKLLDLRLEKHSYNKVGMNDLSFLAKGIQDKSVQEFRVNVKLETRIEQQKVIKSLNKVQCKFYVNYPINEQQIADAVQRWGLYNILLN